MNINVFNSKFYSFFMNKFKNLIDSIVKSEVNDKVKEKISHSKEKEDEITLMIISNILKENKINKRERNKEIKKDKDKKTKISEDNSESFLEEIAKSVKKINDESLDVYVIDIDNKDKPVLYIADKLKHSYGAEVFGEKNIYVPETKTAIYDLNDEKESIKATQIGADVINNRLDKVNHSYNETVEVSNINDKEAESIISDYLRDSVMGQGLRVRGDIKDSLNIWLIFNDPNKSMMRFYESQATLRTRDVDYSRII